MHTTGGAVYTALLARLQALAGVTVFGMYDAIPDTATLPMVTLQMVTDAPASNAGRVVKKLARFTMHLHCENVTDPAPLIDLADRVRRAIDVAAPASGARLSTSVGDLQLLPPDDGSAIAAAMLNVSVEYMQSYA